VTTEGRVARPERRWGCRRGTPKSVNDVMGVTVLKKQYDIDYNFDVNTNMAADEDTASSSRSETVDKRVLCSTYELLLLKDYAHSCQSGEAFPVVKTAGRLFCV